MFVKPIGPLCNLGCDYCYYLPRQNAYPSGHTFPMSDAVLEPYIRQHLEAAPGKEVTFSWHGGEPTLLGLDFFCRVVQWQKRYRSRKQRVTNGIQTNGTLLDEKWARFFKKENFAVGLSLDGPPDLHNRYRLTKGRQSTHDRVMGGHELLQRHDIHCDLLCVVNDHNVRYPQQVYDFFREIGARYISFLPLVEPPAEPGGTAGPRSVPAEAWGEFLCTIFDRWKARDIGRIDIQIFEEATRPALGREHGLCIFRETCGDIPVVEQNGDFFSCDHFVDPAHLLGNILETRLVDLLESPAQKAFGQRKAATLPDDCRNCAVKPLCNGGCPKNRFIRTPDGQAGLNYLCAGYKRFFTHCRPFLDELAALGSRIDEARPASRDGSPVSQPKQKVGRNDPCPCGSGRKYKKCCLGK